MGWFETRQYDNGVTLIWEPSVRLGIRCNMWHVRGTERDALIDSGMGVASLKTELPDLIREGTLCIATHTHFDHIGGHCEFCERAVHVAEADILANPTTHNTIADLYLGEDTFLVQPNEDFDWRAYKVMPAPPTRLLNDGDTIDLGDRALEVLHLPGHSPGSISLYEATTETLFSGDVVYDGVLYDDLEGSSVPDYRRSMERLRTLRVSIVHGGHRDSFGPLRLAELIEAYLERTA